jgi:hypothetical protein
MTPNVSATLMSELAADAEATVFAKLAASLAHLDCDRAWHETGWE